jgi:hypothetical protein
MLPRPITVMFMDLLVPSRAAEEPAAQRRRR